MESIKDYADKLINQKKRTIIVRKEKKKLLDNFIIEEKKNLDLIIALEKEVERLNGQINDLMKEYDKLSHKYYALSNSKLGRLTLKYWQYKKKRA